jgi:3-deoxy-7-phosphoheptulonate synthase
MVESFIGEGSQKAMENGYGKSLTNPCLGWKDSDPSVSATWMV